MMKKLLRVMLVVAIVAMIGEEVDDERTVSANRQETAYTFQDEVTSTRLKLEEKLYRTVSLSGDHLAWLSVKNNVYQVEVMDLRTGKTMQITSGDRYNYNPVTAKTTAGSIVLWGQSNEKQGTDLWSYNTATKETAMLGEFRDSATVKEAVADGNSVAWEGEGGVHVLDLSTNQVEALPLEDKLVALSAGHNRIVYQDGNYNLKVFDKKTRQSKEHYGVNGLRAFASNGNHTLVMSDAGPNNKKIQVYDSRKPDNSPTVVVKEHPLRLSYLHTGLTYGVVVEEDFSNGKTVLTGIDLLYKESFQMPLDVAPERVIGWSGDRLAYFNADGYLVYRSIKAPLRSSERNMDPIYVVMDGETIESRVPPINIGGTTYVEFRPLFERMGYAIKWDSKTQSITGTREATTITLMIGRKEIAVNGKKTKTDHAPITRGGYTYVPLRLVGEMSGRVVSWNGEKRTVFIRPKNTADTLYYEDGTMQYHGDLVNGVKEGFGTLYNENGSLRYVGEWKNDKMHGHGKLYYSFTEEVFFEGTMANGWQAEGTEYYPGGALRYEGTYVEPAKHWEGVEVEIRGSRDVLVVEVHQGVQQGKAILYDKSGYLKIEGTYDYDRFIEGTMYDADGNVIYQGAFDESNEPVIE